MSVLLQSGPAHVLATGTATTFFGHELALKLVLSEGEFNVVLAFGDDLDEPAPSVRTVRTDDGLRFELVNFDDEQGRGSAQPVLLGEVGPDLTFFHFRVFRFGKTDDRTIHYTFYRAAKGDLGWVPADGAEGGP